MHRHVAVLIGSIVALAFAPQAQAETLRVEGVFAARAREASLLPTIGIGTFVGVHGAELGDAIERKLAKAGKDGVPHARLIPAGLRPDGLLEGRTGVNVTSNDYLETRDRCVEQKDGKCVRRTRYRVACTSRTIAFRAELDLRRVGGGRVYDTIKTRDDRSDWCEDRGIATDVDFEVGSMIESVADEVGHDLIPHAERYTVRVQERRDGLPPDAAARFRTAVRLTKSDPAAACAAFAEVDRMAPDNGSTTFNLALCAEAGGRYAEAADRYNRARLFAPKAGDEISKGLERVRSLADGAQDVAIMRRRPPIVGAGI